MRALVIGASGLLGNAAFRRWSSRGWEVFGTAHNLPVEGLWPLDMLDSAACGEVLRRAAPQAVLLAAANAHVDYCEIHPEETRRVNVSATLAFARAAAKAGARVVFISSDYVFDGARGGYVEEDPASPACEYARQKLVVERGISELGRPALTVRMSGLFGWELQGKNFVSRILRELRAGRKVLAANDQVYNPTYAEDAADALADLLEKGQTGLFHAAGEESISRHDFAVAAARAFGADPAGIVPVSLEEFNRSSPVRRGLRTSLNAAKLQRAIGRALWGAGRSLEHMRSTEVAWSREAAGILAGRGSA